MAGGVTAPHSTTPLASRRDLDDPAGQGVAAVRPIRDDIKTRITALLEDLGVPVRSLP